MVVYTPADQALNPEKKDAVDDGIDIEIQMESKLLTADLADDETTAAVYNDTTIPVVRERRHDKNKRRVWLQLILLTGMVLGLTLCIIGSVELFGGNMYSSDFVGRCGVGVIDMKKLNATSSDMLFLNNPTDQPKVVACSVSYYEDVQIRGDLETLKVPKQNKSAAAIFRNDFGQNVTAIRDELLNLCFIVPFLQEFTSSVPFPGEFSAFLANQQGKEELPLVYEQDISLSVTDSVEDLISEFGDSLAEICDGAKPFRTERRNVEASTTTTTTTEAPQATTDPFLAEYMRDLLYTMYPGGDAIYNFHIMMVGDYLYDYDGF